MKWQLYPQERALRSELATSLCISEVTAQVLVNRGITDEKEARRFLTPSLQQLHDPFLLQDMDKAVTRIVSAIKNKEHISIYGDYDADGSTSTALLVRFFRMIGVAAGFFIPNRIVDGYGMNMHGIDVLNERGTKLIITVDNGINAVDEVAYASSLGMDVIVTDHHEPNKEIPKCVAVINPKRRDSKFPFKELAGVGVAFNLLMALRQKLREACLFAEGAEPRLRDLLDIVAIGTVADVVPLIDENRIFVKFGLEEIKKSSNRGIAALKLISGLEPQHINATTIAFRLAPRINAAGRIGDENLGTKLLITEDPEEAGDIAQTLQDLNSKRQSIEAGILKEANEILKSDQMYDSHLGLTLAKEGWHIGVLGIVANRVADEHKKPAVIITITDGVGRGSVRSVGNYNILAVLKQCSGCLKAYGGHDFAGGVTIDADKIDEFRELFNSIVSRELKEDERDDVIMVDVEVETDHVSGGLIEELELLEPFGEGNPEPTFSLREMKVKDSRVIKEKHLKLKFSDNMIILDAIGFGMGHHEVVANDILDVAFIPQMDTWRGNGAIQLKLRDLKQI